MFRLVTAIIVSTLMMVDVTFAQARNSKGSGYEQLNLFGEAFERIRQDAVEPVAEKKLVEAAIAGMLSGLDTRSSYISEAALKASQGSANDAAALLGLVVTIENGQLKVISPQDGSPAARAGIAPGDLIFAIDKEPTYDLTLGEAEQKLRGPVGSEVELTLRHGAGRPVERMVKREAYKLQTVAAHVVQGNIGYLRIDQTAPTSSTDNTYNASTGVSWKLGQDLTATATLASLYRQSSISGQNIWSNSLTVGLSKNF